jgi:hypothetical protein
VKRAISARCVASGRASPAAKRSTSGSAVARAVRARLSSSSMLIGRLDAVSRPPPASRPSASSSVRSLRGMYSAGSLPAQPAATRQSASAPRITAPAAAR